MTDETQARVAELLREREEQRARMRRFAAGLPVVVCGEKYVDPEWNPYPDLDGAVWPEQSFECELEPKHVGDHESQGGKLRWAASSAPS